MFHFLPDELRRDKLMSSLLVGFLVLLVLFYASIANGQTAHPYIKPAVSLNETTSTPVETPAFSEPADTLILEFPEKHEFPAQETTRIPETPVQLRPIPMPYTSKPFDPRVEVEPKRFTFDRRHYDKTFWVLTATWWTGVLADIITTEGALSRGGIESNSLYARNGGKSVAYGLGIAVTGLKWGVAALLQGFGLKWPARIIMVERSAKRWKAAYGNHTLLR